MKNNRKKAVALRYNQEKESVPRLVATGSGMVADNIIKKAQENNIPTLEDPSLVGLLSELDINETIPEELYKAVAEVFAFIYRADQELNNNL